MVLIAILAALTCLFVGSPPLARAPAANHVLPIDPEPSKLDIVTIADVALADAAPPEPLAIPELVPAPPSLPEPAPIAIRAASAEPAPLFEPFAEPVPVAEPPAPLPAIVPVAHEETPALPAPPDSHSGETPMITNGKGLTIQLFLAGWFFSTPAAPAAAAETPGPIADRLQKIESRLADLERKIDLASEKLITLQRDMPTAKEIDSLTQAMAQLRLEMGKLQVADRGVEPRISRAAPAAPPPPPPAGATAGNGQVQLINAWLTPMTVVVDGESHHLRPGEARMVPRPAGTFNYEVLGVEPTRTRTLDAGKTFTVEIAPR